MCVLGSVALKGISAAELVLRQVVGLMGGQKSKVKVHLQHQWHL